MNKKVLFATLIATALILLGYYGYRHSWPLRFISLFQDIPEKIWLHRVNSSGKLAQFAQKYSGFELDIIFNDDQKGFENSHDRTNPPVKLEDTLKSYKQGKIWFDVKNLTPATSSAAEAILQKTITEAGVKKENCLVESPCVPCLSAFKAKGWETALYIHTAKPTSITKDDLQAIKRQVEEGQGSPNIDYLSMDGHMYEAVK